jgi:hypothetical protein
MPVRGADEANSNRANEFFETLMKSTGTVPFDPKRVEVVDRRIRDAALSLADKIAVFKKLAPRAEDTRLGSKTGDRRELRMERLLLSVAPGDLTRFKFALEYDGDYKDLEEYVFHDIDDKDRRDRIVEHFTSAPQSIGIKVLSDVDDTMYANLIDQRYPKKTLYPGVLAFYDSLKREPFEDLAAIPLTALSARPNPIAGRLEEGSLEGLVALTGGKLCPSGLSGGLVSSTVGTVETVLRDQLDPLCDDVPEGQEAEIGRVKFKNFKNFAEIYPEYRYVFVGDSGQADALTARLMVTGESRVITTFIHDLRQSESDRKSVSPAFTSLPMDLVVRKTSATGRGVIVFRNYIDAAVIAHAHSATLGDLVTAEALARVTREALQEFQRIPFQGKELSRPGLWDQYRQDAEEAFRLLAATTQKPASLEGDVMDIRRILDKGP